MFVVWWFVCVMRSTHKLFIITSRGCSNLSDKFYNLSVDIRGSGMTTAQVLDSDSGKPTTYGASTGATMPAS